MLEGQTSAGWRRPKTKPLNLLHLFLIYFITLSIVPRLGLITKLITKLLHNFKRPVIYLDNPLLSVCWFASVWHLNSLSSFTLTTTSITHPTPAKLAQDGITAYTLSPKTQGNFPFSVNFSAFSLLIIVIIFLKFTLIPMLISQLIVSLADPPVFYLISLNSVSSTMINKKGLNIELWCNPNWTRKLSLKVPLILTWLREFLYIVCTILTNHFFTPILVEVYHVTSLGTQSKAFPKTTNVKYKFFFLLNNYPVNVSKWKWGWFPHPGI